MDIALKSIRHQWDSEGWLFVPQLLDPDTISRLRVIAERCLAQWRLCNPETGEGAGFGDLHHMRHLNHSGYYQSNRTWLTELQEAVAHPDILSVVRTILEDDPLFRSTSLFMNPIESGRDGDWHRDLQFLYPVESEERAQLEKTWKSGAMGLQLQIALVPSDDTEFVPGSHLRWDSEDEYAIRCANERANRTSNNMPNAMRVALQPGDAVAFNAAGIHRGRYHTDKYRRTLMLTYNRANGSCRRDYFSDQPWCLDEGYLDGLSEGAVVFWQRFIDTYREFWESGGWEHRGKVIS